MSQIEQVVSGFAARLVCRAGDDLESLVYSPLPFAEGQLLVACKDRLPSLHVVIVEAQCSDPPPIPIHWLRASELRLLTVPSTLGRYPGWSYWLRFRGKVLWGTDIRERIPLPADPKRLLAGVLTHALTWDRNHLFLTHLAQERYSELMRALATLSHSLMATGLLLFGEWEVDERTVSERFAAVFRADGAEGLCRQLSIILDGAGESGPCGADADELYRRSCEGVWLMEQLLRFLRKHVE